MSDNYHYEDGAKHYDHKKVLHIESVGSGDIEKLISAFFKDGAEDAEIVEEVTEDATVPVPQKKGTSRKPKKAATAKPKKPRETMTFGRKSGVTEGHLVLLYQKLTEEGWIEGNEADFKALFSCKRDEDCQLTWKGIFGKGTLVELFKQFVAEGLITVSTGYTLPSILEGHFKDTEGRWLTGLDKGNSANDKALPIIQECVKLLKAKPDQLIYGNYEEDEDFKSEYDPFDHQDMNLHKR